MNKRRKTGNRSANRRLLSVIAVFTVSLGLLGFLLLSERVDVQQVTADKSIDLKVDSEKTEKTLIEETVKGIQDKIAPQKETETELETEDAESTEVEEEFLKQKVQEKIKQMTLQEKVAQLFMITPEALTGYSMVTAAGNVTERALLEYPVGGLIFFAQNIAEPGQLTEMTGNLQRYAEKITGMPLFLAVDEEGGKVARIANNSQFTVPKVSTMREIGNTGDANQAYHAGATIGSYLQEYGLNLDFAPVADVLTNPNNQLLQERSFGSDAVLTTEMTQAYVDGLHEYQVFGCLKHFPGHGGTSGDTHAGYAYTERTLEQIKMEELQPFQKGIENGISFIMVAHIAAEQITGDNTPASLSHTVITDLLREDMGYERIVITDAMNMGAITDVYDSAAAAVKAIQAGADMVLMPADFKTSYQGVLDAVAEGVLTEERIEESLRRILTVKLGMF